MRFRFLCFGPALGRADRAARHMAHNNTITAALRDVLSSAPGARRVHARVDMIEPTGADTMAMLTFAGTEIVARMESGQLPLKESLTAYKRGAELLTLCQASLKDASSTLADQITETVLGRKAA